MGLDVSKKRVIFIHGLAGKPPESVEHELWSKCLIENIRVDDPDTASALEDSPDTLRSAYWASATPHHLEDDEDYVAKLRVRVDAVIEARRQLRSGFHVGAGEAVGAFFKERGEDLVKLLTGALTIKDDVMKHYLRETELYAEDQYIADKMRQRLEEELRKAWDEGCDVTIISHSMGTFISYDVLWRFSHRSVAGYADYRQKRVQMFVTMGSPLCESAVRDMLFARYHRDGGRRQYPTNIDFWHNYACLGDVVCHPVDFDKNYFAEMKRLGILPESPAYRATSYENLHNPFEVVEHEGNSGHIKRDPHKSFGYLVQPRLGTWISNFFRGELAYSASHE